MLHIIVLYQVNESFKEGSFWRSFEIASKGRSLNIEPMFKVYGKYSIVFTVKRTTG